MKAKPHASKQIDKLKSELDNAIENAVDISNKLGNIYIESAEYPSTNFKDSALDYYKLSTYLSEKLTDKHYLAASLSNIGIIKFQKTAYPSAIEAFLKSLNIRKEIEDYEGISRLLHYLSTCYEKLNQPLNSKECADEIKKIGPKRTKYSNNLKTRCMQYEVILKERQKYNDLHGIAGVQCDLGMIFEKLKNPSEAEIRYVTSYNMNSVPDACKAQILNHLGEIYLKKLDYQNAIDNFERSKSISKNLERKGNTVDQIILASLHCTLMPEDPKGAIRTWIIQSNRGLGLSYQGLEKYKLAGNYFFENLTLDCEDDNREGIAEWLNHMGSTLDDQGEKEVARKYSEVAKQIRTCKLTKEEIQDICLQLL